MSCFNNDFDCDRDFGCGCGRRRRCGLFGCFGGCGGRRRRCGCGCGCGESDRDFDCESSERDKCCENVEIKFEKRIERNCCREREGRECGRENRCCF